MHTWFYLLGDSLQSYGAPTMSLPRVYPLSTKYSTMAWKYKLAPYNVALGSRYSILLVIPKPGTRVCTPSLSEYLPVLGSYLSLQKSVRQWSNYVLKPLSILTDDNDVWFSFIVHVNKHISIEVSNSRCCNIRLPKHTHVPEAITETINFHRQE